MRLYQPIQYSGRVSGNDPKASYIGGAPSYFETDEQVDREPPMCEGCDDAMMLMVQLHVPRIPHSPNPFPTDRTIYVFACNQASCWMKLFERGSFVEGGGVVACRRSQPAKAPLLESDQTETNVKSAWATEASEEAEADNDWDVDADSGADLETMMQAVELSGPKGVGSKSKKRPKPKNKSVASETVPQFKSYEIHAMQEPATKKATGDYDEDDDNVGVSSSSDDKIRQMLERYMAEEEDEEILSALRGSGGTGPSNRAEEDERLPPEERAMLAFTDRVKRAPRQVLRYAKDGEPLLSM